MKAALIAVLASMLVLFALLTGEAMATTPSPAVQSAGQSSSSDQSANATATSTQSSPSNVNIPVRILRPGDDGSVDQQNSSVAAAGAVNLNATGQSAAQSQGSGGAASQTAGQDNGSGQTATSTASSTQDQPANYNIPVRILSPGNDGSVKQSNDSTAGSLAVNLNATDQQVTQDPAGAGAGVQAAGQQATSSQSATSTATSTQDHPVNYNIPVRILSPGNGGSVTQSNGSTAVAIGGNANLTTQDVGQDQAVGGMPYLAPAVQAAGQLAKSTQCATAGATSTQDDPSNVNVPVRVLSPGDDGSVKQSNDSAALALAGNLNLTGQTISQDQAGTGSGPAVQGAGQEADNQQHADGSATSSQSGATNTNTPVRILSPGGGGSVEQSNSSTAIALALNANLLCQQICQRLGIATPVRL